MNDQVGDGSACFLRVPYLIFHRDDGGSMFFRNLGKFCRTVRHHIEEHDAFHIHHLEKFK
jgi:hypothetical protein